MKKTHNIYGDTANRTGSTPLYIKILETLAVSTVGIFIACMVGSMIWGNEGFVELLAGLIN